MSPIVHLGPLALASDRLAAVAAVWLFITVASHRYFAGEGTRAVAVSALVGFLVARLAYAAMHAADFGKEPLAIIKVWQGGFVPLAGISAAAMVILIRTTSAHRLQLIVLLLASVLSWFLVDRLLTSTSHSPLVAANAKLTGLGGEPFDLTSLGGRPLVVNLWASWCPPCRREMPLLAQAARDNPEITFLFVNQGEAPGKAAAFPTEAGVNPASIILDQAAKLSATYGGALPATIFVGRTGDIRSIHSGEISRSALSDQVSLIKETIQ